MPAGGPQAFRGAAMMRSHRLSGVRRCFSSQTTITKINGIDFRVPKPGQAFVAVLLDGTNQDYIDAASSAGLMPNWQSIIGGNLSPPDLASFLKASSEAGDGQGKGRISFFQASKSRDSGAHALATSALPSLPDVNVCSVASAATPMITGIAGSAALDPNTHEEEKFERSDQLRCPTVLQELAAQGVLVSFFTHAERFSKLLIPAAASGANKGEGSGASLVEGGFLPLDGAPQVSLPLSKAGAWGKEELFGFDDPSRQARTLADRTLDPLRAALSLLRSQRTGGGGGGGGSSLEREAFFSLVQTSSELQQLHRPGSPEAQAFYGAFDGLLGELLELGAVVGVTSSHGMGDKSRFGGSPRAIWLEDWAREFLRQSPEASRILEGSESFPLRVVLPAASSSPGENPDQLAGWALLYLDDPSLSAGGKATELEGLLLGALRKLDGVYTAMNRAEASQWFDLPADRIGDLCVVGNEQTVFGASEANSKQHPDLGRNGFRSFGSLGESVVPMLVSRPLQPAYFKMLQKGKLRNYQLLQLLLNGVQHDEP